MDTKKEAVPASNAQGSTQNAQSDQNQTSNRSVPQKSSSVNNGLREGESLKALIASKYGRKAITYFSKLMNDINAGIKNEYGNAFASKMVSQYKKAKMGANVRVVIQQPVSYLRAAALIDSKYLAAASGHKVDFETVFKYSPIAQWKDWGFFSIDTGKSMYDLMTGKKELSDYTMALAGEADSSLKDGAERKVKYSLKKHFNKQVDDVLDKKMNSGYHVYVGKTSHWLVKCGFNPDLPMLMTQKHIRDINHEKSPDNIYYHGLDSALIKQIPNELADTVMIYDSITPKAVDRENAVCIVTKLKDGDELPIIISVKANQVGDAKYYDVTLETQKLKEKNDDRFNLVASEYGKDDFFEHINDVIMQDALLYANKKKTLKLFSDRGLQLPTRLNSLGFDKIIHQSRNIVNPYSMQKSENNSGTGKKYSIKFNGKTEVVFERSFAEQVNEVLSAESDITDGNHVFVCKRTSFMKQLGFLDLPTLITKGHLRDMHHPEVEGINKYHGMSEPEINLIPEILDNPAMVFKSISDKNPDAICFLSHKTDGKGRSIQVVIDVNGEGKYTEVTIDANIALSAYGKDGFKGYLSGIEQKNENVMYINQKRTQELLKGEGLQLPARLSKLRFNSIIHRIDDFVNIKAKIDSKTPNQNIEIKYGDSKKSLKMDEDILVQNAILKKANRLANEKIEALRSVGATASKERLAKVAGELVDEFDFNYSGEQLAADFEGLSDDVQLVVYVFKQLLHYF